MVCNSVHTKIRKVNASTCFYFEVVNKSDKSPDI